MIKPFMVTGISLDTDYNYPPSDPKGVKIVGVYEDERYDCVNITLTRAEYDAFCESFGRPLSVMDWVEMMLPGEFDRKAYEELVDEGKEPEPKRGGLVGLYVTVKELCESGLSSLTHELGAKEETQ